MPLGGGGGGGVPVPYPAAKSGSSCEGIIAHSSCVAPDNRNGGEGGRDGEIHEFGKQPVELQRQFMIGPRLRGIQCQPAQMTLYAPKIDATF